MEFGGGMSVLSGETGAGKSILIGSMNAISGNKLDRSIIRRGQDHALVEMQFELTEKLLRDFETDFGIPIMEDRTIILSRKYNSSGRSIYRANGMTVTAQVMRSVFDSAIDIHSQHEHQSLLNPKAHIDLLDQYLGENIDAIKKALVKAHAAYMNCRKKLRKDDLDDEHRIREMDFLRFEINEIESADLKPGEDKQLSAVYKKLSSVGQIEEALSAVDFSVRSNDRGNIYDLLAAIIKSLSKVAKLDDAVEGLNEEALQMESFLYDFTRSLDNCLESLESDPAQLAEVSSRIDTINGLKHKYGNTIEEILQSLDNKKTALTDLENYDANIAGIRQETVILEQEILEHCGVLSEKRKAAAVDIAEAIQQVLEELNFNNNRVVVDVAQHPQFTANGFDSVTIMISTNKNEPVKPLNKIASGGELSRVMLALKSVFADMDQLDTLVFDEIDTGISGRTAQKVAEKMVSLSRQRQIICITHLPQIAAMADSHYLISKEEVEDHIESTINLLKDREVHEELSRLIGGASITEATMKAAREMKELADAVKKR